MALEAHVVTRVGPLVVDVRLCATADETVVLVGPNGAGKTTFLRALAGLVPLEAGRVVLDGEVLDDREANAYRPPERRSIGFVFQDELLFPHLDALGNVAFGLRARGVRRSVARRRAAEWLERVGLADRATARPCTLSGGEAQRVALARALAVEPRLMLLDEPLAALDASARLEVRRELQRHLAAYGGSRLVVTHDPVEAMALGDRLVVVEHGSVVQSGPPAEIRERPRSPYVADLVGLNLFRGRARGDHIALAGGGQLVAVDPPPGDLFAVVHPRAVALHRRRPEGTPRNVWSGVVDHVDPRGDRVRVLVAGPITITAEVTPAAIAELGVVEGARIWSSVKATEVAVYPA